MDERPLLEGMGREAGSHLAATMARAGLFTNQLMPWWSPDVERMIDPMNDPETRVAIVRFLACLEREAMALHASPRGQR